MFEETGKVEQLAAGAGADQRDLGRALGIALGVGLVTGDILRRIAAATDLRGGFLQRTRASEQARRLAGEELMRQRLEHIVALERLGHQLGAAVGAIGRPVVVALKVEGLPGGLWLTQQGSKVRGRNTQAAHPVQGLQVVQPGAGLIEAGQFQRRQAVGVQHAATGRHHQHQFDPALGEPVAQALEGVVTALVEAEVGAKITAGAKQPLVLGLHQRRVVFQLRWFVIHCLRRLRAQLTAGLGRVIRQCLCPHRHGQQGHSGKSMKGVHRQAPHSVSGKISAAAWRRRRMSIKSP